MMMLRNTIQAKMNNYKVRHAHVCACAKAEIISKKKLSFFLSNVSTVHAETDYDFKESNHTDADSPLRFC